MTDAVVEPVSETAFGTAAIRADESERADAVFHDPFARKLAGQRGREFAMSTPSRERFSVMIVGRTTMIDRLVQMALARGVDTVINLGAGLDTRPYRMDVPPSLRWIEVDFSHVLDYKRTRLAGDKPICDLQRIAADLSRDADRQALFARLGSETRHALILSEGVVGYLSNDQNARLSRDLFAVPTFAYWVLDYCRGRLARILNRGLARKLSHAQAPLRFEAPDWLAFFQPHGWAIRERISALDELDRIGRRLPFTFPLSLGFYVAPKLLRDAMNRAYGGVMFGKP